MKIYLNFIMKNEEKVLLRMLNSVLPIIDGCVCIDTGSTDSSKEIVKDFFENNNLPYKIYDHPFVNFSDARNFALEKLKLFPESVFYDINKSVGFWLDCDEELVLESNFDLQKLHQTLSTCDQGLMIVNADNNKYGRTSFFKIDKPFHWKGAVHEYLTCSEDILRIDLENMYTLVHSDGHSWDEKIIENKYSNHAKILLKEVIKYNDPRDIFYLAQSYKDAKETDKAIEWYTIRANRDDGFIEEKYYSQYMITLLNGSYKDYFKAHELDTLRGEHILNLIIKLQNENFWQMAYVLSSYAIDKYHNKNPYPLRTLFLNNDTYAHKIFEAHNLNCIKTNQKNYAVNLESTYNHLCESPSDINYHLPKLKEYAEKHEHVTEMGVRWCVSTYALLHGGLIRTKRGQQQTLASYDINYNLAIENVKEIAYKERLDFSFYNVNVLETDIDVTDFLFIDTWHCAHQLEKELKRHARNVRHAIAFHDTETFWEKGEDGGFGLKYAMEPFLESNKEWKEVYRTSENNGLLIIERQ